VTNSAACLLPSLSHLFFFYTTSDNNNMASIEELINEIGLSEAELRRVLKKDEPNINRLVVMGIPRDEAEHQSFRGDLRNILSLMRSHRFSAKTAARILGQTPEEPFEFHSTEEEDEQDEDEDEEEEEQEQEQEADEEEEEEDDTPYPESSCSNSIRDSCSLTSSDNEEMEAKRIRLDPDYAPSTTSDGTETPAATAPSSQVPSEEEEEEDSDEETEVSSYVPSGTMTADESEPAFSEEAEEL
jgi:hypothetical protein